MKKGECGTAVPSFTLTRLQWGPLPCLPYLYPLILIRDPREYLGHCSGTGYAWVISEQALVHLGAGLGERQAASDNDTCHTKPPRLSDTAVVFLCTLCWKKKRERESMYPD